MNESTEPRVYEVPEVNMDALNARFAKVAKRAAKLGMPTMKLNVQRVEDRKLTKTDPETREKSTYTVRYYHLTITGEPVKVAGWEFVGHVKRDVLEDGTSVQTPASVPGHELPASLRDVAASRCDHCHREIQSRLKSYVLRGEDGSYKVVGSNCIVDFIGHDPSKYAAYAEALVEFEGELGAADDDHWSFYGSGLRGEMVTDVFSFLSVTAAAIRTHGWWSKAAVDAYNAKVDADTLRDAATESAYRYADTTRSWVESYLEAVRRPNKDNENIRRELAPNAADEARAAKVLAWAQAREVQPSAREYEYNLFTAVKLGKVYYKTAGVVASLFSFYDREMNFEVKREVRRVEWKEQAAASVHVGTVGKRQEFTATVSFTKDLASDWGTSVLVKMADADNNILVAFVSSSATADVLRDAKESGAKVTFKATVKSHNTREGAKETQITRIANPVAAEAAAV